MKTEKALLILVVLLAPSICVGQATLTGSPITGDVVPSSVQSVTPIENAILAAISASAIADDNNNSSALHPIGGTQYYLAPSLALQQSRSRLRWNLAYSPGLRLYVPSSAIPAQFSQMFGGTLRYDASKRFGISVRQDYLRTNDPFQQLGEAPLQPGIGLLNRPGIFASRLTYTMILSQAELDYKVAKHTVFGVNGDFMQMHYHQNAFIDVRNTSGSAFVSHQFMAKQSIGMQYQLLNMVFRGDSRTISQGVFVFDQIAVNPHIMFSIFAGPQYSRIHNQEATNLLFGIVQVPISKAVWSPATGAMLNWRGDRIAVEADVVRRVAEGGGLLSSVEMNQAGLHIRKTLARRWIGNLSGEMTQDTLLNVSEDHKLRRLNVGAGISHELARNIWAHLSYERMHQTAPYLSSLGFGNHNRVTLTVDRSFIWPLGRQ